MHRADKVNFTLSRQSHIGNTTISVRRWLVSVIYFIALADMSHINPRAHDALVEFSPMVLGVLERGSQHVRCDTLQIANCPTMIESQGPTYVLPLPNCD